MAAYYVHLKLPGFSLGKDEIRRSLRDCMLQLTSQKSQEVIICVDVRPLKVHVQIHLAVVVEVHIRLAFL